MPTLHVVTKDTRAVLKWGIISCIVLAILWNGFFFLKNTLFPPKEPPPTVTYGVLPNVIFPKNFTDEKLTYTLNTISGSLPSFPDKVNVYQIINPIPNLLDLKNTENLASGAHFTDQEGNLLQETQVTPTLYSWTNPLTLPRTLKIDITTNNFNLTSPYATNSAVENGLTSITTDKAPGIAEGYIEGLNPRIKNLDDNLTTSQPLNIINGVTVPAKGGIDTKVIRVDFFQKNVDILPGDKDTAKAFYTDPPNSSIYAIIGDEFGQDTYQEIFEANAFFQDVDTTQSATYPIITAAQAYQELQEGKAFIAGFYGTSPNVVITNVEIGYYVGNSLQQYTWPVIVFSNPSTGFYAYVPAITDQWIQK